MEQFQDEFRITENALTEQSNSDKIYTSKTERNYEEISMLDTVTPLSPYHFCRLLLSHFGLLSVCSYCRVGESFVLTESSDKLQRILNQLDKSPGREVSKLGLIYVQEGQEIEKEILKNDRKTRSALFTQFVNGLGWPVKLNKHKGYLGGLDEVNLTTGDDSPYYSDHGAELIFHDITSMISDPSDDVQLLKKRHVGNDIVQIVWSEHARDYNPNTIVSQFNDAHIVVYPLRNGLFRIQIFKKHKVPMFGPLLDGMVLNSRILSMLVRQSAINANRGVRATQSAFQPPYSTRRRYLQDLVKKVTERNGEKKIVAVLQGKD